jgi:hypothetical protein
MVVWTVIGVFEVIELEYEHPRPSILSLEVITMMF